MLEQMQCMKKMIKVEKGEEITGKDESRLSWKGEKDRWIDRKKENESS